MYPIIPYPILVLMFPPCLPSYWQLSDDRPAVGGLAAAHGQHMSVLSDDELSSDSDSDIEPDLPAGGLF